MSFKSPWFAALLGVVVLAACQTLTPTPTAVPTQDTLQNIDGSSSEAAAGPRWIETEQRGVRLGIQPPEGWAADINDGLLMAEHRVNMEDSAPNIGMLTYIFVASLAEFDITPSQDENPAWLLLDRVVEMPSRIGDDVAVSEPAEFTWGTYDAAYYLLSSSDGTKTVLIALALPESDHVIVCNISVPGPQAGRIRAMLPVVLDGLTVNEVSLEGAALDALPNPLFFPTHSR